MLFFDLCNYDFKLSSLARPPEEMLQYTLLFAIYAGCKINNFAISSYVVFYHFPTSLCRSTAFYIQSNYHAVQLLTAFSK
mmetsp:Transcript_6977/g.14184  ORF Transcript_6977/g.14184 Transcript_6977/m.14184 type:complete len:80 (-) Transcript_6977:460-699(-)